MIVLVWLAVLIAVAIIYFSKVYSKLRSHGIKHFRPIPLFGNMHRILFRVDHIADDLINLYRAFPNDRFVGKYEFMKPSLLIRDLDLVKKIGVKDFEHFLDHSAVIKTSDSFISRTLLALEGQEWKDMRSTLSPAFTSSKIRHMVPFMVEVGDQMLGSLQKKLKESKTGYVDLEAKDLMSRYTNDVIASCAFGLKVDSHNDVNNEFYAMGKASSDVSFTQLITFFITMIIPAAVTKFLKLDFFTEKSQNFFKNLVLDTIADREKRKIIRPDMIHLLMEAKKGKLTHEDIKTNDKAAGFATTDEFADRKTKNNREWTENDLIAQGMLFWLAGFETVSTGMSFLLHELAMNPDVQDRLAQEIKDYDTKNDGKFDFNSIQNMQYLDMVVSESLRRWPPVLGTDRLCIKDYNLGRPSEDVEEDFIIRKGTAVQIPTVAYHYDPEYFPNPEKFDPERFSEENKHKIKPFSYLPFGVGPRNCIGSRFALCEIKVMVYQVLLHMEISPCEKTCIPAKLSKETFNMKLEGGHWLRFRPRDL